jgi:hypothetical protein
VRIAPRQPQAQRKEAHEEPTPEQRQRKQEASGQRPPAPRPRFFAIRTLPALSSVALGRMGSAHGHALSARDCPSRKGRREPDRSEKRTKRANQGTDCDHSNLHQDIPYGNASIPALLIKASSTEKCNDRPI